MHLYSVMTDDLASHVWIEVAFRCKAWDPSVMAALVMKYPALTEADLSCSPVTDLGPLAALAGTLRSLRLSAAPQVSDFRPVSSLTNLEELCCEGERVHELSWIVPLTRLRRLDLVSTLVVELDHLSGLRDLTELRLNGSGRVRDLSPLSTLTNLQSLDLSETRAWNLEQITALTGLRSIGLKETRVRSLAPLSKLTALESIDCSMTAVSDLTPLGALSRLRRLNCFETDVRDIAAVAALGNLEWLNVSQTPVGALSPLMACKRLRQLEVRHTNVADFSPLMALLASLEHLECDNDVVQRLPAPLQAMTKTRRRHVNWDDEDAAV